MANDAYTRILNSNPLISMHHIGIALHMLPVWIVNVAYAV